MATTMSATGLILRTAKTGVASGAELLILVPFLIVTNITTNTLERDNET